MSLISQNTVLNGQKQKTKRKPEDVTDQVIGDEDVDAEESEVIMLEAKKNKKKKKLTDEQKQMELEQNKEMKKLENFLFGSLYTPVEFGKEDHDDDDEDDVEEQMVSSNKKDSALFFSDRSADSSLPVYEEDDELSEMETEELKPVWVDDEEEETNINISKVNRLRKLRKDEQEKVVSGSTYVSRLRAQHVKLNQGTEWAQLDSQVTYNSSDDEEEDDSDIFRTGEDLVVKGGGFGTRLLPGILGYSRLVDANREDRSSGPINSVQFHRNAQLLLTGGLDKKLRFFQIDGKSNTKIQSIFLDDCPIRKAAFLPEGSQVIVSGRRKFFYSFDLVKATVDKIGPLTGRDEKSLEFFEVSPDSSTIAFLGNEGYILLVSTKTKQLIGTLKMNGTARSLAFAKNGEHLLSSGGDGHVYHWDLRTRTCFHKGVDEGCINGTSICTNPNGTLFATGSDSGIVNVYNREDYLGGKRKPMKTIENLTTKVDLMKFNQDSQILAITSTMKKNSLKLVHIPSFTVFSNWPHPNHPLHYPRCLDFSPGGGFMAMGNAAGKVFLYKLHHYNHA